MDFATQPHTSFIPKAPLASPTPSGYRKRSISIVMLISLIIFIISLGLAGGVFLYKKYLEGSLVDKQTSLEKARAAFDPALIQELQHLDKRIEHSKDLLARHMAFSALFSLLESSTLQNVQFKSLRLMTDSSGKITAELQGIARSYASVALQSQSFNTAKGIKDPIFSQLNLDSLGNVVFSVSMTLDTDIFKYANLITPPADASSVEDVTVPEGDSSTTPIDGN